VDEVTDFSHLPELSPAGQFVADAVDAARPMMRSGTATIVLDAIVPSVSGSEWAVLGKTLPRCR
jgi:hypothetical protein